MPFRRSSRTCSMCSGRGSIPGSPASVIQPWISASSAAGSSMVCRIMALSSYRRLEIGAKKRSQLLSRRERSDSTALAVRPERSAISWTERPSAYFLSRTSLWSRLNRNRAARMIERVSRLPATRAGSAPGVNFVSRLPCAVAGRGIVEIAGSGVIPDAGQSRTASRETSHAAGRNARSSPGP